MRHRLWIAAAATLLAACQRDPAPPRPDNAQAAALNDAEAMLDEEASRENAAGLFNAQ